MDGAVSPPAPPSREFCLVRKRERKQQRQSIDESTARRETGEARNEMSGPKHRRMEQTEHGNGKQWRAEEDVPREVRTRRGRGTTYPNEQSKTRNTPKGPGEDEPNIRRQSVRWRPWLEMEDPTIHLCKTDTSNTWARWSCLSRRASAGMPQKEGGQQREAARGRRRRRHGSRLGRLGPQTPVKSSAAAGEWGEGSAWRADQAGGLP